MQMMTPVPLLDSTGRSSMCPTTTTMSTTMEVTNITITTIARRRADSVASQVLYLGPKEVCAAKGTHVP